MEEVDCLRGGVRQSRCEVEGVGHLPERQACIHLAAAFNSREVA
jgi:hypothetical protein